MNTNKVASRLRKLFKHHQFDILKVLIVTVVVFSAVSIYNYKSEHKHDFNPNFTSELDKQIAQALEFTDSDTHLASGQNTGSTNHTAPLSYDQLCSAFSTICKNTTFNGAFSDQEKFDYFAQVIQVISRLDNIKNQGYELAKTLAQLVINPSVGARRGSSGWTKMTINLGSMKYSNEFWQVFTHEIGHIMDLGALNGSSRTKSNLYTEFGKASFAIDDPSLNFYRISRDSEYIRKSGLERKDFCSGYGMSDPFEDWAECHNLFLNHHDVFQLLASTNSSLQTKYNYFNTLYNSKYFSNSEKIPNTIDQNWRPWDSTRILE